jgi:UDP-N-acetylmuramyl pentapeptide synthase
LAVIGAVAVLGFDCRRALDALGQFTALPGRGGRRHIPLARGQGEIVLIDESYNASPASMRAALQVLGDAWQAKRRIAILGDMRELGVQADALHADLAEDIRAAGIDKVFLCGSHMAHLWRRLPENIRAAYGAQSVDLAEPVRAAVQGGDWVLVKGSLGSAMAPLAKTIEELGDAV